MKNYNNGIVLTNGGIKVEVTQITNLIGHDCVSVTNSTQKHNFGSFKKLEKHEDEYDRYMKSRGRFHRHYY